MLLLTVTYTLVTIAHSLTPYSTILLEKLTDSQLVKKFPAFYGTRRYITAFTCVRHLVPIPSQLVPVHTPTSHLHLNIILPSTPGSPKWSLFIRTLVTHLSQNR